MQGEREGLLWGLGWRSPRWPPWQVLVNLIHIPLHPCSFPRPSAKLPSTPSLFYPSPCLPPHTLPHNPWSLARGRRAGTAVRGLEQGGLCA